eukprot:3491492-Amphidinium_carterae.1
MCLTTRVQITGRVCWMDEWMAGHQLDAAGASSRTSHEADPILRQMLSCNLGSQTAQGKEKENLHSRTTRSISTLAYLFAAPTARLCQ